MLAWLSANVGNIIVLAILSAVVFMAVRSLIKQKKSGKGGCGCGCQSCAMQGRCHQTEQK